MPGRRALAAVALAGALGVATSLPAAAAPSDSVRDQQQWVLTMLDVQDAWAAEHGRQGHRRGHRQRREPGRQRPRGRGADRNRLHQSAHPEQQPALGAARDLDGVDHRRARQTARSDDGIVGVAPEAKILSIRVIPDMNDPGYKKYDGEQETQIQDELADGINARRSVTTSR